MPISSRETISYLKSQERFHAGYAIPVWDRVDDEIYTELNHCLQTTRAFCAVQIQVIHGLVTLSGNVATKDHKTNAETMICQVPGVIEVQNRLIADTDLFERVKSELASDLILNAMPIKVIIDRGIVSLKGIVSEATIRSGFEALILHVSGVVMIINEIIIA